MDEPTAIDKLGAIEDWVQSVKNTLATESISYGELSQIDAVYASLNGDDDAVHITWMVDDVYSIDDTLTQDEARDILKRFEKHHEGSMESMWVDLEYHVDEFKRERDESNE